jgi:hypothetical protein
MHKDLYVRFVPYTGSHKPKGFDPVAGNLRMDTAFYVIDINSYSDVDEAYFGIVDNDGRPIWLSNRYVRILQTDILRGHNIYHFNSSRPSLELSEDFIKWMAGKDGAPIQIYKSKTPGKDYLEWHRARWSN